MRVGLNTLREEKRRLHAQLGYSYDFDVCCTSLEGASTEGGCCDAHHNIYKRITQLWTTCVYSKPELAEWHKLSCLMAECEDCGVDRLSLCP